MNSNLSKRIALSSFFFLSGFTFAAWTSRIPTIKENFNLDDKTLGLILLILPLSSLLGIPLSGWLVSKYETRKSLLLGCIILCTSLTLIGFVNTIPLLIVSLFLFSFFMRILNVAMNTQSIYVQELYTNKIIGSFHGMWSVGGMAGIGISTLMVYLHVSISNHLLMVSLSSAIMSIIMYFFSLSNDKSTTGNKLKFGKPNKFILILGLIVFCTAFCEGGMFDWSGVYFKDVVKTEIFTYGFLVFMTCMGAFRFFSDFLIDKVGRENLYCLSSSIIALGMLIAVIYPHFWSALIGFSLVGIGTASIIPMTFALTHYSENYSPGTAIAILSTYGMVGMFLGPPIIGLLSDIIGLKYAFLLFLIPILCIIPLSKRFFKENRLT